ncbi:ketoreductase [Ophiostoma piceae UAMH 11346]|uniref:Ketoreductase n=1 Tax=Ophiostoma piceae (strain UAMH 11346) TaxID=1262450 RepID=S3CQZ0_OPHP1|nr:ketoreductase [Ophiostoma piceae UAMH 11346]
MFCSSMVRTEAKGKAIVDTIDVPLRHLVSYVLVDDVACEGSFDDALQTNTFDYVIHTASPYQLHVTDPVRDFLDPAVRGTRGLLQSVHKYAPSVRRVVLTSSSAAMINPHGHAAVYNESCWRPMTWADAQLPQNAYEASKVFSERAAWALVNGTDDLDSAGETALLPASHTRATLFDLSVINCTYTFGPVQRWLTSLDSINTSNHRIRDLALGRWLKSDAGSGGMPPTRPVFTWVDVRDVAVAHVQAILVPEAGGRRFYVVGGHFSNGRLAAVARASNSETLAKRIPPVEDTPDDMPRDVYQFDNSRSRDMLGIKRYRCLEESVMDTVDSILDLEKCFI